MISSRVSAIRALKAGFSRPIYNAKKIYKHNRQVIIISSNNLGQYKCLNLIKNPEHVSLD